MTNLCLYYKARVKYKYYDIGQEWMNKIDKTSGIKQPKCNCTLGVATCLGIFFMFLETNNGYKMNRNVIIIRLWLIICTFVFSAFSTEILLSWYHQLLSKYIQRDPNAWTSVQVGHWTTLNTKRILGPARTLGLDTLSNQPSPKQL